MRKQICIKHRGCKEGGTTVDLVREPIPVNFLHDPSRVRSVERTRVLVMSPR